MTKATGSSAARRVGRRAGDSGTRDAILHAARQCFAERGYKGATMRDIAAQAGVDPALIRHFFHDKDTLFATVLADRAQIFDRVAAALPGDPATLGQRITETYLGLWEDPDVRPVLLTLVRSAASSTNDADLLREALGGRIRAASGGADANQSQAYALAAAQLFGVAVARHVLRLQPLTEISHDDLVARIAPTVQGYLAPTTKRRR